MQQAKWWPLVVVLGLLSAAHRSSAADPVVIPLWEDGAPGAKANRDKPERPVTGHEAEGWIEEVHNPSLTVYLPAEGTSKGAAIVVAPCVWVRSVRRPALS
jgi:hypothetical protein